MREGDIKRGAVFQGRSKRENWGVGCWFRGSARREAGGASIPRWCGVGHCRSRGLLQQVLAVSWVGRELLPHVPTSGLRVGGGAGGGAATPTAAAVGDDGAGGAGVHRGRGPLLRREVGLAELGLLVPLPLLLQAQAQVVVGESGRARGGGGRLRRNALRGVAAASVVARGREGGGCGG